MEKMDAIFPLQGVTKYYDWGGYQYIAKMLLQDNPGQKPFAEYWMGTHPQGMAQVETAAGEQWPLERVTGQLSFLFKVLDVRSMLSIQVHPSKKSALIEFERENQLNIP
jgi:mannose-6-phosphate isomerase